jgi:hypothetical protein
LGAALTIQPCKKVIVMKPHKRRPGPEWAAEPCDDDYCKKTYEHNINTYHIFVDFRAAYDNFTLTQGGASLVGLATHYESATENPVKRL